MLKKLYKHEFTSLYRILIPLYGLLIGLSAVDRILSMIDVKAGVLSLIEGLSAMVTGLLVIGLMFGGFILVIVNYYKSLLGKQGYLTLSLPVKVKDHIICKLVCGIVTFITTIIAEFIAICILTSDIDAIVDLFKFLINALESLNMVYGTGKVAFVCFEVVILAILVLAANLLMYFAAMAIGQQFKRRILASVGMFFGLYFMVEIILSLVMLSFDSWFDMSVLTSGFWTLQALFLFLFVCVAIEIVLFFAITNHFLSKKLNLE